MRMAVKTSPITAAPPFSVHLTGERERADGFTLSPLAGEPALGRTGFARRCVSEYAVLPLLGHFGPEPTPATFASVAIDPELTLRAANYCIAKGSCAFVLAALRKLS